MKRERHKFISAVERERLALRKRRIYLGVMIFIMFFGSLMSLVLR